MSKSKQGSASFPKLELPTRRKFGAGAAVAAIVAVVTGLVWIGSVSGRLQVVQQVMNPDLVVDKAVRGMSDSLAASKAGAAVTVAQIDADSGTLRRVASILDPEPEDWVSERIIVRGNSRFPSGLLPLWVWVYSERVSRFYPQERAVDRAIDGSWAVAVAVGDAHSSGERFDVLVSTVDDSAERAIRIYLDVIASRQAALGLASLPVGAVIQHRISVQRRLR